MQTTIPKNRTALDLKSRTASAFKRVVEGAADGETSDERIREKLQRNEELMHNQKQLRRQREQVEREEEIQRQLDKLAVAVGRRHSGCKLDRFMVETDEQRVALDSLTLYGRKIEAAVRGGVNILLSGTPGTGKTHCLSALAKQAIRAGFSVAWRTGPDLWLRLGQSIKTDTEHVVIDELIRADVFVLDDPLDVAATLSDYRRGKLYHLIDARNRDMRPTWVAVNMPNRAAIDEAMGKATVDRLLDGALRLPMAWPSRRTARNWQDTLK